MCRWHIATAVAFPQKSKSSHSDQKFPIRLVGREFFRAYSVSHGSSTHVSV